ncbi:MAG TPA: YbfB/YjiJ family MFS transporter [Geminicoccus sp.]|uniref:YbfB/YjiJ family MFS transporter n=1 Tax=Geminicoccus sp. TaxID=2024832 RepID=UPI002B72F365|nr:YbfB/YjiJ family MFS transporter [Geminicoccus sp.]HWL67391.1 YbfB/YjiJ family MFS transporter [Geminicoccus sp.]
MTSFRSLRLTTPLLVLVLAGFAALLAGIGLGRFAYAALVPGMVGEGWLNPVEAGYLAGANVIGYLVGAASGGTVARRLSLRPALRVAMIGTALSLAACALPVSFAWLVLARFVAGVTGGILMVLAAPAVLAALPPEQRASAGGLVFTGIGVGITFSGVVVPFLAEFGSAVAWLTLAGLAAFLAVATWQVWPGSLAGPAGPVGRGEPVAARPWMPLLAMAYGCDAVGFVPHTVYWVDFVARELGEGIAAGGLQWSLFGIGAALGPATMGLVAARLGFGRSFTLALAVKAAAVLLPVLTPTLPALVVSSILVGALTPATASLASGRITELLEPRLRQRAWARLTMMFALLQALGAVLMAELLSLSGEMSVLFLAGGGMLALGAVLVECHRRLVARGLHADGPAS